MVIVRKTDEKILVGLTVTDALVNMTKRDLLLSENLPFWKVKGTKDCYVFAEDLTLATDLLRYNDYIFKNVTDGNSVITEVVPKIKELLDKYSQVINGKEWESQLLIIKGDKIFTIGRYFTVSEINDFDALGYKPYLLGGLEVSKDLSPEESILFAVRMLNKSRSKNLFPLVLFDTKTKKRKVIYE
jgi:hypothetical protein